MSLSAADSPVTADPPFTLELDGAASSGFRSRKPPSRVSVRHTSGDTTLFYVPVASRTIAALRRASVVVALLGLLAGLLTASHLALTIAGDLAPPPRWFATATTLAGFAVSPLLVAVTGYWVGSRLELSERYLGLFTRFALCGAPAVFVGYLLAFLVPQAVSVWELVPAAALQALFASAQIPLAGLAGATLAHFES